MTGIFFDVDDTLYSRKDLLVRAAREAARHAAPGLPLDGEAFLRIFYIKSDLNFSLVESGAITAWQSNVWRLEQTFLEMGLPCPEGCGETFADTYTYLQNHISLSPALETMFLSLVKSPAQPYLGILTNGESGHQWNKVDQLGLLRFLPRDHVIVSGDIGISKPEEGIFRAAEAAVRKAVGPDIALAPSDFWLVGDSLKHDILGAGAVGWKTLWINRSQSICTAGQADLTVRTEEEMAQALIGLCSM